MYLKFATCDRDRALGFIKAVYPRKVITDTPDCAGPLLDYVARDVVRIEDPVMHGSRIGVIPATNWSDSELDGVRAACALVTRAADVASA